MVNEVWKDIKSYEGRYLVSNLGHVMSTRYRHHRKIKLLNQEDNHSYKRVCLFSKDGKRHHVRVHRLVAEAFIPNPNNYLEINHKDENPTNNNVNNLEWCDRTYNINYGTRTEKAKIGRLKGILQYDKNNNLIDEYCSIAEASRKNNFKSHSNIVACAKGRLQSAYGYIWKYSN